MQLHKNIKTVNFYYIQIILIIVTNSSNYVV